MYISNDGVVKSYRDLMRELNISFPRGTPPEGWSLHEPKLDSDLVEKERLKTQRDFGQFEPIEVNGLIFDADINSQRNIETAIRKFDLVSVGGYVPWTLKNNTVEFLTKEDLIKVEDSITLRYLQYHKEYTEFKLYLISKQAGVI